MNIALNEMYLNTVGSGFVSRPYCLCANAMPGIHATLTFVLQKLHFGGGESIRIFLFIEVNNLRAKAHVEKKSNCKINNLFS